MDLPVPVNVAVVCVGTDDAALKIVVDRLGSLGHRFLEVQQKASGDPLLELLSSWIDNPEIDVVLAVASDTDPVRAAVAPLVTRSLPGFGELLRIAAFGEIGSSAMTLDAEAARCGSKYVFVIPGTVGAVKVALERLLIPQLDLRTRPSSLAAKLPRLRKMAPPADAFNRREHTEPGTGLEPRPASGEHPIAPATPAEAAPSAPITDTPSAASRTAPPFPPPRSTKTPPMGVVLRAPAKDSGEIPMINSDAAIPIQPAVIVDDEASARPRSTTLEVEKEAIRSEETAPRSEEAAPAIAVPRTSTDELAADQIVEAKAEEPPPKSEPLTSDNVGAFVRSLEAHAKEVREKSQVGPLPRRPKTEPPPLPKKTDAELKAARDADVSAAISHVGPRPEAPRPEVEPADEPAPPPRRKNTTTQAEWLKAQEEIQRQAQKPAEPTLAELDKRSVAIKAAPKKRRGALLVPLLLGVAAAGGYVVKTQLASNGTASAQPQPQVAVVAPPPQPDQPQPPVAQEPEIVVDLTHTQVGSGSAATGSDTAAPNLTSVAQAHHHTGSAASVPHETGSATGSSAAGSDEPADPRTHPNVAPASPDCDEASCILEKYARECCARYKPAEMPVEKIDPPKPAGPPDTLDKAAVKAGIADVKPAVQQCGEDHYKSGTVKITLTVSAAGEVTDATVADSPDPELGKCVAAALRRASFSKTQNGAVFTYPFAF